MKYCPHCEENKPDSAFGWKNKTRGWLQAYCKQCNRAYQKQHYKNNKATYNEKAREAAVRNRERNQKALLQYLLEHPCVDCGETDPIVLEFDHLDPATKVANVSQLVIDVYSWEKVLAEIAKCEVVCSNCHKRRTAKQYGWFSWKNCGVVD